MDYLKSRAPFWKKETGARRRALGRGAGGGRGGAGALGRATGPELRQQGDVNPA